MADPAPACAAAGMGRPALWRSCRAAMHGHEAQVLFFLGTLLLLLAASANMLQDPDTYWHLATGRQVWAAGAVPRTDTFSHTFAGSPWIAKEWLSQGILYGAYALGGWSGVTGLVSLVIAGSFTALLALLGRHVKPTTAFMLALAALALSMPSLNARPQVFAVPLLVLWVGALVDAVERGAPPSWWLLAVAAAWANLHASFPVAIVLAGCFGLEAMCSAPRDARVRVAARWASFGAASVAATLVTPYGWEPLLIPLRFMGGNEAQPYIHEWQAPDLDLLGGIGVALFACVMAVLLPQRRTLLRAMPVILCGWLAFNHARFLGLFAIVAVLAVAGPLARRAPALSARPPRAPGPGAGTLAALAALALACAGVAVWGNPQPSPAISPASALQAARSAGLSGPVYNGDYFGGFLIANGVPTFMDGRNDQLFGGGFTRAVVDAENASDPGPLLALLDRYRVTWAMVPPAQHSATLLGRAPGWAELHRDGVAVVFAKRP